MPDVPPCIALPLVSKLVSLGCPSLLDARKLESQNSSWQVCLDTGILVIVAVSSYMGLLFSALPSAGLGKASRYPGISGTRRPKENKREKPKPPPFPLSIPLSACRCNWLPTLAIKYTCLFPRRSPMIQDQRKKKTISIGIFCKINK